MERKNIIARLLRREKEFKMLAEVTPKNNEFEGRLEAINPRVVALSILGVSVILEKNDLNTRYTYKIIDNNNKETLGHIIVIL